MNFSGIPHKTLLGRLLRLPLALIPTNAVVPILQGRLRGKKWITGSYGAGCWLGSYEHEAQQIFASLIKPGGVVFDVGANVGFYTLLASELVGPNGRVYAFEPLPDNLKYLQRHLEINHITNAAVIPAAVSESCGTGSFEEGPSRPASRLSKRGRLRVDVVALDALVSRGELPAPDFMKMDIEGGEALALSGARTILEMNHPTVFLSTHGHDLQVECSQLLHAHGYTLRDVTPRGDPFPQFLCVPRPTRDSSPPL